MSLQGETERTKLRLPPCSCLLLGFGEILQSSFTCCFESQSCRVSTAQSSLPRAWPLQCLPLVTAVAASHHHPSPRIQGRGEEHCNGPHYSRLVSGNTERFSGRRWGRKAVVCQDLHEPEIVPLGHDLWNSGIMGLLLIFPIEGLCFQFSYQITKGKLQMMYWNGY